MIGSIKQRLLAGTILAVGVCSVLFSPILVYAQSNNNLPPSSTAAENSDSSLEATTHCSQSFLTFPAWYNGLLDGDCSVKSPTDAGGIVKFVVTIVLNIVEIILRASGYASVAFIIYGGFKYIYSAGSPDGMVSARKTIMNAVIGLVISLGAIAIVNTIARGI